MGPEAEPDRATWDAAFFADQRQAMVEMQLRQNGITDERVLAAMSQVPREEFVPETLRGRAYRDGPLPIGLGQTISQPYTVAFMCQALQLLGHEKILDIGTGSGYAAAVLSLLAARVFSLERIPELAVSAATRLRRLGYANVEVIHTDGTFGLPEQAPFDAIVVAASAASVPGPFVAQIAEGGRIVMPIGGESGEQRMYRLTKRGESLETEMLGGFAFVPLIGEYGHADESPC